MPPPAPAKPSTHVLDIIDRMLAAPPAEKASEPASNRHAGAAAAVPPPPPAPILAPKGITVERTGVTKDALDEAADLFKVIFKGEIVP